MMKSLSSVGIGLSVVFTCLFLALIAELYYLFWWKKRLTSNRSEIESHDYTSPAKELFYMFCWRKHSVFTHSALNPQQQLCPSTTRLQNDNDPSPDDDFLFKPFGDNNGVGVAENTEFMRMQMNHPPPRFLFTIIEETKEELESEDGKSCKSRKRSLSDLLLTLETPYLTPLASPPFFTPPLTPGGLPLNAGQPGFNFLSDPASGAEVRSSLPSPSPSPSSPPPKFRFLQEAEEKLRKKRLRLVEEDQRAENKGDKDKGNANEASNSTVLSLRKDGDKGVDEDEDESFITITVDHKNKSLPHNPSTCSQVLPLSSSPSTFTR